MGRAINLWLPCPEPSRGLKTTVSICFAARRSGGPGRVVAQVVLAAFLRLRREVDPLGRQGRFSRPAEGGAPTAGLQGPPAKAPAPVPAPEMGSLSWAGVVIEMLPVLLGAGLELGKLGAQREPLSGD